MLGWRPAQRLALAVALVASQGCGLALDASPPDPDAGHPTDAQLGGHDGGAPTQDASVDAGGRIDAGRDGGPGIDAGPACAPSACDDGNPCTDDACNSEGACVSVPNTAPCDDGNPCTGPDQCADGTCQPGGDPCAGSGLTCDPRLGTCVGCVTNADCPDTTDTPSACSFDNPCTTTGTQSVVVHHHACDSTVCVETGTDSMDVPCTRPSTDGDMCGTSTSRLGTCTAVLGGAICDTTGTQTVTVTDHVCVGGSCNSVTEITNQICPLVTDGLTCHPDTCGMGICLSTDCTTLSGVTLTQCMSYTCASGACVPGAPRDVLGRSCLLTALPTVGSACSDGSSDTINDRCSSVVPGGALSCTGCALGTTCPTCGAGQVATCVTDATLCTCITLP